MSHALAASARRPRRPALVIGILGLVLSGIGFVIAPRQAYASWLAALAAGLSLVLGVLLLVTITAVAGGRWFDPLRGAALDVAATVPLFALLFLVLVPGLGTIYPWVHPSRPADTPWLTVPWFVARAVLYFAIWIAVGLTLRRWARAAGGATVAPPSARERGLAAAALPALGLSLTFAAFDWLMPLAPGWGSTAFGVYWFAGGILAALAQMALVAVARARRAGDARLPPALGYGLGALMLTFAIFWAYIAYSQFFIIWIADVPAEAAWYLPRSRGSWGGLALLLLAGQFVVPLLFLLFRAAKLSVRVTGLVALWLLVMHYLDNYWLVLPAVHPDGAHISWLDLSALAAVVGTTAAWVQWLGEPPGRRAAP
jgi:hypothetical protein